MAVLDHSEIIPWVHARATSALRLVPTSNERLGFYGDICCCCGCVSNVHMFACAKQIEIKKT